VSSLQGNKSNNPLAFACRICDPFNSPATTIVHEQLRIGEFSFARRIDAKRMCAGGGLTAEEKMTISQHSVKLAWLVEQSATIAASSCSRHYLTPLLVLISTTMGKFLYPGIAMTTRGARPSSLQNR
jgi:hypothetical protein